LRLVLDHRLVATARLTVNLFAGHIFIFAERTVMASTLLTPAPIRGCPSIILDPIDQPKQWIVLPPEVQSDDLPREGERLAAKAASL
jgi:hypothetical protein